MKDHLFPIYPKNYTLLNKIYSFFLESPADREHKINCDDPTMEYAYSGKGQYWRKKKVSPKTDQELILIKKQNIKNKLIDIFEK